MTDARIPDRWLTDRRIQRLSDAHFRSYVNALAWSVANRTDGVIEPGDLGLIPNFAPNSAKAFVGAGLWAPRNPGWLITDFQATQTSRSEIESLERVRARERVKSARRRAEKSISVDGKPVDVPPAQDHVPGTVPGTCPGDVNPDYTGKARQGKAGRQGRQPGGVRNPTETGESTPTYSGNGHPPSDAYTGGEQ